MKAYLAQYNDCIYESSFATLSVHLSKEGAEKAVQEHKDKTYKEWEEMPNDYKKEYKYDEDIAWKVREIEILP